MRLSKTLISCVAMTAVTAVSEVAADQTPCTNYNKLTIVNNFDPSLGSRGTNYFGKTVPNNAIWLFCDSPDINAIYWGGPGPCSGHQAVGQLLPNLAAGTTSWVSLDQIKNSPSDGFVYLENGTHKARIYALIYGSPNGEPPNFTPHDAFAAISQPKTAGGGACDVVSYAYALFEFDTTGDTPNCDISFVDQFSFPTRLTVKNGNSITGVSGFDLGVTADGYLNNLQGVNYNYANGNNTFCYPANYTPPPGFTGLSSPCQENVGRLKYNVDTGTTVNASNAYRFDSLSRAPLSKVVGDPISYVCQCPGQLQELLYNLYTHPQNGHGNGPGFYFASSMNLGFSFYLIVTLDPNGSGANTPGVSSTAGYGLKLTDFREVPTTADCNATEVWGTPFANPKLQNGQPVGTAVLGSLIIAADGVVFPHSVVNGAPDAPARGLWTTATLLTSGFSYNLTAQNEPVFPTQSPGGPLPLGVAVLDEAAGQPGGITQVWNGTCSERKYQDILQAAIGRVATAIQYGMPFTSPDWQLPDKPGWQYYCQMISYTQVTDPPVLTDTKASPYGSCVSSGSCKNVTACYSLPAFPFGNPNSAFFQLGKSSSTSIPANTLLGSTWVLASENYTGSTIGSIPPYLAGFSDTFAGVSCNSSKKLGSPDLDFKSTDSAQWELGVGQATCESQCSTQLWSDINDDGATDGSDVTLLLQAWGTNQQAFDFDSSGVVDSQDLSRLLSHLGDSAILATIPADPKIPTWAHLEKDGDCCPPDYVCPHLAALIQDSGYAWRVIDNATGMPMLFIPQGTFSMGCTPSSDSFLGNPWVNCMAWETWVSPPQSQRTVTLPYQFYMSESEVTQFVYQSTMHSNPSTWQNDLNLPVENVSYDMIAGPGGFLARVNGGDADLSQMRLPTEAEWEYACRAPSNPQPQYAFSTYNPAGGEGSACGNTSSSVTYAKYAWNASNSGGRTHVGYDPRFPYSMAIPVTQGHLPPNGFGLYNMLGNVWEWTNSPFNGLPYNSNSPNPSTRFVLRGGYYANQITPYLYPLQITNFQRSSYRGSATHDDNGVDGGQQARFGFRVVRSVPPLFLTPPLED